MHCIQSLLIIFFGFSLILCTSNWSYEILSIKSNTSDTETVDIDIKLDRISRGVFGLSGFMDLKVDIDDLVVNIKVYRSFMRRDDEYRLTPFAIDNEHLKQVMNTHYRKILMPVLKDCATNSPQFAIFEPPLKKAYITFNKCVIPTDNFPNLMPDGNYKYHISIVSEGLAAVFIEVIISIDKVFF